jgi:hypothetical protein
MDIGFAKLWEKPQNPGFRKERAVSIPALGTLLIKSATCWVVSVCMENGIQTTDLRIMKSS